MLKKIIKSGRQQLWISYRDALHEKHELKYLFWECTLNCNFKCKHCGSNAGGKILKEVISTTEIKNAFLDVSKNFNAKDILIAVTGGEPLLRKDLFEVMEYAHGLGFKWGMVSNGSLMTETIAEKAEKAGMDSIDISIDGIGIIHDEFRNTEGAYENAIKAVKILVQRKFAKALRISTTIHSKNIKDLEKMYQTFSALGVYNWRPIIVDPIGRAICNKEICLNKEELAILLNFVKEKRKEKTKMNIALGCAHFFGDEFEDEVRNNFFNCATGINIGSILYNGDIFVCPNVPRLPELIQGNIKTDSFSQIWNEKFQQFRDKNRTKSEKCHNCEHWEKCRGGAFHTWDYKLKQQRVCYVE